MCPNQFTRNIVTVNGRLVWKHGPNWPLDLLMLKTTLYQSPFFFTVHQNVNKPKSRVVKTLHVSQFFLFCVYYQVSFSFLCQDANISGSTCVIKGCKFAHRNTNTQINAISNTGWRTRLRRS